MRRVDGSTGTITTVAGNGAAGFGGDGGPATNAALNQPTDVAVDGAGKLYVADRYNARVRKVDPSGTITTVAGTGGCCFSGDGGPATGAELNQPVGLDVDAAGSLYIAQKFDPAIRWVDTGTGIITTVAGNGTSGFSGDNGPATGAQLNRPMDIVLDANGNLFVAGADGRIRKIATGTGVITTVAGGVNSGTVGDGGPATSAETRELVGVEVDSSGNLFLTDSKNHRIRRVDAATQIITRMAGALPPSFLGDGSPAIATPINTAIGLDVDSAGNLLFVDNENHLVRRVDASTGIVNTVAGNGTSGFSGDGGPAIDASLNEPQDVVMEGTGNLFISDQANHRIRKVDASTGVITTVVGTGADGFAGDGGPASAAQLNRPILFALDPSGNLFIADTRNNRVRRVDSATGVITTVAGTGQGGFSGDGGLATSAGLTPLGVNIDRAGNLLIADANNRIRLVNSSTGIITTVAGTGACCFSGDGGPATNADVGIPHDVVVDATSNLFISEIISHRIRRVDAATGVISTVVGSGPVDFLDGSFSGDGGPATSATLSVPIGLAIDSSGNLFIADHLNHVVRKAEGVAAALPDQHPTPIPSLTLWGLIGTTGLMALALLWRRARTGFVLGRSRSRAPEY